MPELSIDVKSNLDGLEEIPRQAILEALSEEADYLAPHLMSASSPIPLRTGRLRASVEVQVNNPKINSPQLEVDTDFYIHWNDQQLLVEAEEEVAPRVIERIADHVKRLAGRGRRL